MLPVRIRWRDSNRYLYQVETTEPLCVETIETCGFLVRKEKPALQHIRCLPKVMEYNICPDSDAEAYAFYMQSTPTSL